MRGVEVEQSVLVCTEASNVEAVSAGSVWTKKSKSCANVSAAGRQDSTPHKAIGNNDGEDVEIQLIERLSLPSKVGPGRCRRWESR